MCKALREVPLTPEQMQPVVVAHLGLHSHTCSQCGHDRACYAAPCRFRGRATHGGDRRTWICGLCAEQNARAAATAETCEAA